MKNLNDSSELKKLKEHKKKLVQDLIDGVQHKKGCHCELCLWREANKEKRPGRPYDFLTFLIPELIRDLKFLYLRETVKAEKVERNGKETMQYPIETLAAIEDINLYDDLKDILMDLPEFEGFPAGGYREVYLKNLNDHLIYRRFDRVLKKLDEIDSRITERNKKRTRGRPKKSPLILWREMREFIELYQKEKGKSVPKRILQREFNLYGKDFDNNITFLKYGTKLKSKTGKQKNQILYFY